MTGKEIFEAIARGDAVSIESSTERWIYANAADPENGIISGVNQYGDDRCMGVSADGEYNAYTIKPEPDFSESDNRSRHIVNRELQAERDRRQPQTRPQRS